MPSSASWWGSKARQLRAHLRAGVAPEERAGLVAWTAPEQLALYDSMHVADRRHGLDVVAALRAEGVDEGDAPARGVAPRCGQGRHRGLVASGVLARGPYGSWIWRIVSIVPAARRSLERLRDHAETSATLRRGRAARHGRSS